MTATPARIGFVTHEWRRSVASDAAVKTKYGEAARDTGDKEGELVETFFDDPADALVMATERLNLLKADRRRFRQEVNEVLSFTGALDFSQVTPAATVIDDERSANHAAAIVEIPAVDFGSNKTTVVTWG